MLRRYQTLFLVIAAGLLCPAAAQAQPAPTPTRLDITEKDVDASLEDEWLGLYFQGKKIGYVNSKRTKENTGKEIFYRERLEMNMKLQSLGEKADLVIEQVLDYESKPPFRLLRAEYSHINEKIVQEITLNLDPKTNEYQAIIIVGTVEQKKRVAELDFNLSDSLSTEIWLKRSPAKGQQITTRDLELDQLKIDLLTTTMLGTKESLVDGVKVVFHEVKSVSHRSNVVTEAKYDDKGRVISGTIAGTFEMRRETKEKAKDITYSEDLFLSGLAKLDKGLGEDTAKITGLVLELKGKDFAGLPDGSRQTVVAKGDDTYHVQIGKKHGKHVKASDTEIKDGLEETVSYPILDAKVKDLAAKAVGNAKNDEEKAKNICKFVHDFIEPALSTNVPKMHDLVVRKSGDCKAYALMFTCLCRASGLASREVSGFVYMGDAVKSFGGHAWNEVLLDGYWVPVDASLNQVDADATHICLGTEKESANNLLKTFGKLNFKLVEVERGK